MANKFVNKWSDIDLSKYSGGFTGNDKTAAAEKNKINAEDAVKNYGDFSYAHQGAYDDVLDKILNRKDFSYDLNGDALYQQYRDKYIQQGKMAMMDTMGQAAALTGGYGNSYAATVGNQAYQDALQNLGDIIPELYQLAYDRYAQEGQDLLNQYGALSADRSTAYGEWGDKYNRLVSDRDYYGQDYSNIYGRESDDFYNRYNMDSTEYWNAYNVGYNEKRDAIADARYEEELELQKKNSVKSSGGSSSRSNNTYKPQQQNPQNPNNPQDDTAQIAPTANTISFLANHRTQEEYLGRSDKTLADYKKYITDALDEANLTAEEFAYLENRYEL